MDDQSNERDDSRGGLGRGGPQRGEICAADSRQDEGGGSVHGEGQQRDSSGSSRDSEKLG